MVFTRAFILITLMVTATTAHATESQAINGRYNVQWNNIPIASIKILITEDADSYNIYSKLRSSGIVRWVKKFKRQVWAEGLKESNDYAATHYKYTADYGHKKRTVQMRFNTGDVASITVTPPDNPNSREILTPTDANNAYDPLTMLLLIRDWAQALNKQKTLAFAMIDGRRLMEINLISKGHGSISYQGEQTAVIHLTASRTPIKGFSDKELAKYAEGEPELHIYVSTTAPHIPLLYRIETSFGNVEAVWNARD